MVPQLIARPSFFSADALSAARERYNVENYF